MSSVIEINGRRYDAHTGAALDAETPSPKTHQHLDGIVAPSHIVRPSDKNSADHAGTKPLKSAHSRSPEPPAAAKHRAPSMQDVVRPSAHVPQPTRTLMRRVVSKPAASSPHLKAQGGATHPIEHTIMEVAPKMSAAAVDSRRLQHAQVVPKSQLVSRYNQDAAVTPRPPSHIEAASRPAAASFSRPSSRPAAAGRPKTTADLLQRAIDQATSHRQPAPKLKHSPHRAGRIMSISTLALLSVLLFGFVLHLNMSHIKLDLASSKAGFAASLPGNQPSGFSLKGLDASTGQVALQFGSNSDSGRTYSIIEKSSPWDSITLRDAFVAPASGDKYQTVTAGGRTLYLYGRQNITWVNAGVWYQVHSEGALSNQQLINIATSL